jgi:hypothetical protein
MRPEDIVLANLIRTRLIEFSDNVRLLPGIRNQYHRECLIEQMIDSTKRIKYVKTIRRRNISIACTQAESIAFDPFKAAVYFINQGNINEAFWMVFFGTHFGKHKTYKWNLSSSIYGRVDPQNVWTWDRVSTSVLEFRHWLNENEFQIRGCGSFSNHRKYQSLGAYNE